MTTLVGAVGTGGLAVGGAGAGALAVAGPGFEPLPKLCGTTKVVWHELHFTIVPLNFWCASGDNAKALLHAGQGMESMVCLVF
jgi:hypothetical protein